MKINEIKDIIEIRTQNWSNFEEADKEIIKDYIKDVFDYCKEQGIEFDQTAGTIFATHLTTLYRRIHEKFDMELDEELVEQLSGDLLEVGEGISVITEKYYKKTLPETERFLILTHLGSMKERLKEGIAD